MFNYIDGTITEKRVGAITVDCGGVGFELIVSDQTYNDVRLDEKQKVYTYLQTREDGMTLFGFSKREERALFFKLITVSGVGAKSAINILSSESIERIAYYIASSDVKGLSTLKGVGKKTAERIIVELKDKVSSENVGSIQNIPSKLSPVSSDAVTGLLSLGFTRIEAEDAVAKAMSDGASELEDIISRAIKRML
ncbi:MAG: Holliday junction branch migration protein RuvA [Clostridia bacterium]